jgi:hypothetical protein
MAHICLVEGACEYCRGKGITIQAQCTGSSPTWPKAVPPFCVNSKLLRAFMHKSIAVYRSTAQHAIRSTSMKRD